MIVRVMRRLDRILCRVYLGNGKSIEYCIIPVDHYNNHVYISGKLAIESSVIDHKRSPVVCLLSPFCFTFDVGNE